MVDWPQLLRNHNIEFVETGPSTARGNVYVKCPWCQDADAGHHMGISIRNPWRGFGCWKNNSHRGKNAARLLAGLLHISFESAEALLDFRSGTALEADSRLGDRVRAMLGGDDMTQITTKRKRLRIPKEIKPLDPDGRGQSKLFVNYLVEERGYTRKQVAKLCHRYELHYCMSGPFSYRLVIPIYDEQGLVTWTGRSISKSEELRYLTLTRDEEKATKQGLQPAREPITNCLFNEPELMQQGGRLIIVCEGPLDAMRTDFAAARTSRHVRATCVFGKAVSPMQIDKLDALSRLYDRKILLLDQDAALDSFRVVDALTEIGFRTKRLPKKWKDPGEMPLSKLESLIEGLLA